MDWYFAITGAIKWFAIIVAVIFMIWNIYFTVLMMVKRRKDNVKILSGGKKEKTEEQKQQEEQQMEQNAWNSVVQFSNSMIPSEWKLAVIEADKIVDDALKMRGYPGESMGERLMSIDPSGFVSLQEVWDAHKLRNTLVHDMRQEITKGQAVAAVNSYQNFLQELGFFN